MNIKETIECQDYISNNVSHLRVFGCTTYVLVKKDQHKQLQSHTQKCIFLGYPSNYKGWVF